MLKRGSRDDNFMSAKDIIHEAVKMALIKDGWIITDDPYTIEYNDEFVY